jgi:CBS domain-containing protein
MNRKLNELLKSHNYVVHSVKGDDTLKAAVNIMNKFHIGALLVLDDKDGIAGILTERDIMKKLAATDDLVGHTSVKSIMTPKEKLIIGSGENTIEELMGIMMENKIRHIPILDEDKTLRGLISIRDIIRILLEDSTKKVKHLNNYIMGNYPM